MKRTSAPKRKTPLPRSSRPIPRRRSKPRRTSIMRDRKYLDWLVFRHCACCPLRILWAEHGHCDPAHGPPAGMRIKGPDNGAIPLCRHHHDEMHRLNWGPFEAKYRFAREREAALHYEVYLLWKEGK